MNGDLNKFLNGELVPRFDRVIELSVEGVNVPDDCAVVAGVIVAAQSQATNLPFCHGWSFQELECTKLLMGVKDRVIR